MTRCPASKRVISNFPVLDRAVSLVAVKPAHSGGIAVGSTGHFRPHPIFDWLHENVKGRWRAHETGLIRCDASFSDRWTARTNVIAFADAADAVHFRLSNPDDTGSIEPAWWVTIEQGEYRSLANSDIAVTRCGLVKKAGTLIDVAPNQHVRAHILGGQGSVGGSAIEFARLAWGTEAARIHTN
jgi:hypothetical protein